MSPSAIRALYGNLRDLKAKAPKPKHSAFKAYEPGYIHIDVKYLPQMADETSRRYLFVAIDRATRWVFIRVFKTKTAANARRFLRDLERACPLRIRTILTPSRDIAPQCPAVQWTATYMRNSLPIWHQIIVVSGDPGTLKFASVRRLGQRTVSTI